MFSPKQLMAKEEKDAKNNPKFLVRQIKNGVYLKDWQHLKN